MSDQTAPTNLTVDPYEYLGIIRNHDGSITRLLHTAEISATADLNDPGTPVLTKDIPLNQSNKTWLRVFLPRQALDSSSSPTKLPLLVYYHGGGFIIFSAASTKAHNFCNMLSVEIPAIVVSVEYRLAPEHRLPAAYDDAVEALQWIKTTQDEWFQKFADFSNCFLMGTSSGGNIAYHAGLRVAGVSNDLGLAPLKIKGLILIQPFFGGAKRTESELRLVNDKVFPLCVNDLMWELGLPVGVDRDHEYCNPTVGTGSQVNDQNRVQNLKVLVTGCDGDPMIDRQVELVEMLEKKGVQVVAKFRKGDYHGGDVSEPSKAKALCVVLKEFILALLEIKQ